MSGCNSRTHLFVGPRVFFSCGQQDKRFLMQLKINRRLQISLKYVMGLGWGEGGSVSLALVTQHAIRMRHIVICGLSGLYSVIVQFLVSGAILLG